MRCKLPFCAAILALSLLAGCAGPAAQIPPNAPSEPPAAGSSPTPELPPETAAVPENTPQADDAPDPTSGAASNPSSDPGASPCPVYEFGVPVEAGEPVADDSFFDNAVFLGDSRTEGLQLFSGLKHGTFYWARGMTVFRADDEDYKVFEVDGKKLTMMGALGKRDYDAVYIMIGVNELGYSAERYEQGLSELVDKVLAVQPEAVVYLQIMPPLNDAMCRANKLADYINNANVQKFNEVIRRVAAEKKVALLNTAEAYTGEDGQLPEELANDGCHFAYSAYSLWADYMRAHTIDPERYFSNRENA